MKRLNKIRKPKPKRFSTTADGGKRKKMKPLKNRKYRTADFEEE